MGFFEKVKNMFTEEIEEDDVKVDQIKSEVTKVAIESPNAKEELLDNKFEFQVEEKTPIFFDDNDFRDFEVEQDKKTIKEHKREEKEIYGSKIHTEPVVEKKIFKPTPIISPVYGVLDKNYHKEDIISRNEKRIDKEVSESSIDAIRNKAYGTLEDELENTLFGSNSILFKKDEEPKEELEIKEVNDDILSDLTDDISKELDELLIKKEKYIEDDIKDEEKDKSDISDDDLLGFIDSTLYKDGDEEYDN